MLSHGASGKGIPAGIGRKRGAVAAAPARRAGDAPRPRRVHARTATVRRETAQSQCRRSRRHRSGPRRRRRPRAGIATHSLTIGSISRSSRSPGATAAPAGGLIGLAVLPLVEALRRSCGRACRRHERLERLRRRPAVGTRRGSRPTCRHTSRPTTSASSIGPIGMPNRTAAWSMTASGTPSPAASIASVQVGHQHAIDEESRRAAAGQRQLVDAARERERGGQHRGSRARSIRSPRPAASAPPG